MSLVATCVDIAEMDIFFRATKISQLTKVNCDIRPGRHPWS